MANKLILLANLTDYGLTTDVIMETITIKCQQLWTRLLMQRLAEVHEQVDIDAMFIKFWRTDVRQRLAPEIELKATWSGGYKEGDLLRTQVALFMDETLRAQFLLDYHVPGPSGAERIKQERLRQIEQEGWTPEHDDAHEPGTLTVAALHYAAETVGQLTGDETTVNQAWPWDDKWWKPAKDPVRNLEKAGALIAAEIDRIKRKRS